MTQPPDDMDAAGVPGKPSGTRRMIHILGAGLVAVVLPVVVLYLLLGKLGATAVAMGLVVGVLGSKLGGTRRMLYLASAVGVAGGLGARHAGLRRSQAPGNGAPPRCRTAWLSR